MHTLEQIQKMFAEMGLGSEAERAPFLKLGQVAQEPQQLRKVTFIIATTNTVLEENEDGELERNPQ